MIYEITKKCQHMMANVDATVEEVVKNNGIVRQGIRIRKKDSKISAVVYMDDLEEKLGHQLSVETAYTYICSVLANDLILQHSIESLNNWDTVKGSIRKKLVNYERNKDRLQDKVYRRYLDLAEVCYIILELDGKTAFAEITLSMVTDLWKTSIEDVFDMAKKNMEKEGYQIHPLSYFISLDVPEEERFPCLYIVTSNEKEFGASILANPSLFKDVLKDMSGNYYIFPSSIHEVILKEESLDDSLEDMQALVREVNEVCVSAGEYLSDNVYYYNANTGEIILCE